MNYKPLHWLVFIRLVNKFVKWNAVYAEMLQYVITIFKPFPHGSKIFV